MSSSIGTRTQQLHPLQVAMKRNWERIIREYSVKQDWLALEIGVDKSRISRWKNPEEPDFPDPPHMAKLIEALQMWPGVKPTDPIEGFNHYFGCAVVKREHSEHHDLDVKSLGRIGQMMSLKWGKLGALLFQVMEDQEIDANEEGDLVAALPEIEAVHTLVKDFKARVIECRNRRLGEAV